GCLLDGGAPGRGQTRGARLQKRAAGGFRLRLHVQGQVVGAQEDLNRLGKLRTVQGGGLGGDQQRRPRLFRPAALVEQRLHGRAAPAEDRRPLTPRPDARRQERL